VLRAKHKVKAFAFAPRPSKGSVATCTLALGNNSIEVGLCTPGGFANAACLSSMPSKLWYMLHRWCKSSLHYKRQPEF
jgi:hypothetical protein